jgi:tRNA(Ile)-lysidine synthase
LRPFYLTVIVLDFKPIAHMLPEWFGTLFVAYSGGIDSHVLLDLCASQVHLRAKIIAVYINHGLQLQADDWEQHCRQQAADLNVNFLSIRVDAKPKTGESPEAAARDARYHALETLMQVSDLMLFAQHREDQMETLLLQLFRGAGIPGLAAMPESTTFGRGTLLRPLLNIAKTDIVAYAHSHGLHWVDDPSNLSHDFDRNYLRHAIVPLLKQRWPAIDKTIARSARHCGDALALLDEWGNLHTKDLFESGDNSLNTDALKSGNEAEINWTLRRWLKSLNLKPFSDAALNDLKSQLLHAKCDAYPLLRHQGRLLTRFRQQLFCLNESHMQAISSTYNWPKGTDNSICCNGSTVSLIEASSGIPQTLWNTANIELRPRCGGEKLKLPGRAGQHSLKKLFQEAGIPPWERDTRPLLYLDGKLAAIPGLWTAEWAYSDVGEACYRLTWQFPENV